MALSEELKTLIRESMLSHQTCAHKDPSLCYLLILTEVELRQDAVIEEDEMEAVRNFIVDFVIEGLILKGMMEPMGISPEGDFFLGLTEKGRQAEEQIRRERGLDQ